MFASDSLRRALDMVGALLADDGQTVEVVVIGGGALLLDGVIQRPTKDLDAVAIVEDDRYQTARPFPEPLREAVIAVADLLGLAADWFNGGPTSQLRQGLPDGFASRTRRIAFGGLTVQVAGRFDQICLKLYAAADHAPGSKHVADLRSLAATAEELRRAAIWVKTQDASPDFERFVDQVVEHLEASHDDR
jgi:hypothetical protein